METDFKKKAKSIFLGSIILSVIISVGLVLFFGKYYFNRWYLENIPLDREDTVSKVVIQSPQKVEVTQDLRIKGIIEQLQPSLIAVYSKKPKGKNIESQIYQPADFLDYGVILTSDGWLLTTNKILNNEKENKIDLAVNLIVIYKQQVKEVQKIIIDHATDTVLLKIEAVDLPVVKFGSFSDLGLGEQVLAMNQDEVRLTNILSLNYTTEMVNSSEKYYRSFLIAETNVLAGSAVINFQGNLIGLIGNNKNKPNQVIPIDFLQNTIKLFLSGEKIIYPYLGLNFIDLGFSVGLNKQVSKELSNGALLYGRGDKRAVASDSPAAKILSEGDIIISIDGINLDPSHTLSELILTKKVGAKIAIDYIDTDGQKQSAVVTLK